MNMRKVMLLALMSAVATVKQLPRVLTTLAFAVAASSTYAHGTLQSSIPKNGSVLSEAPKEIRLQFNEPVEPSFTSIKLLGPDGKTLQTEKAHLDKDDATTVVLALPGLTTGVYRAQWSAVGHDGHRVKGEISFSVK